MLKRFHWVVRIGDAQKECEDLGVGTNKVQRSVTFSSADGDGVLLEYNTRLDNWNLLDSVWAKEQTRGKRKDAELEGVG